MPAVDGGAAASSSGGSIQEAKAKPSLEGAAGASRPPFICRIEVVAVASVREGKVGVEPNQFNCLTGIMVPGGEDLEPYMVGTVLNSGAESCVSVRSPYTHYESDFRESTWFNLMTVTSIRWYLQMGGLCRLDGRRGH